ncbi:CBS domain-containing protein [Desulfonatronum thiodismutans]|uniref:CBS domain-containing protein n=1 Tax=Desulfonatronum thiodismutans TaxID=159290 RepID=UPI00068F241D|nr:CBS domain-containing protein [Desulfonatronum thiodismutans]
METTLQISELMRPVDQFPRISDQAFFYEVMQALEKANEEFLAGKAKQRILLVEDQSGSVVGKISPKDVVRSLEPQYDKIDSFKDDIRYGLPQIVESMKRDYMLWQEPLSDLCSKAGEIKAERMVSKPGAVDSVKLTDRMDSAFHLFVTTGHDSLYVMDGENIVGLLRFSDIYTAICKVVSACGLKPSQA